MEKKNNITLILVLFLALAGQLAFGQSNNVRGMYVKGINSWLGNTSSENAILSYAQGNAYTYITFYDLGSLNFSSSTTKNALASFINRAKTQYGLLEIGAAGENSSFFSNNIIPYNNGRSSVTEKFDVLNFEFEFWVSSSISSFYCSKYLSPNGFSCDSAGAYKFAKRELLAIEALANAYGLISEMYLGWPNKGQIQDIANTVDRILLHAYRPNDADVYQYSRNRLIDIASTNHPVKIIPIFSAESSFMGSWLNSNSITKPYQTYSSFYAAETGSWKQNINLQGYHWFTYSELPKTISAIATITASGPTTFCTGSSVTLTANSGSAYLWSPGGQATRSILATTSGTYTVRVTNTSGTNATSSPIIITAGSTSASPTITASGSLTLTTGNASVTLTSSSANSYLWSNGATTQNISVNTAGSYSVTINGGTGCSATSAALTVSSSTGGCVLPPAPVITASSSLNLCQGSSVTLTSSTSNGYLWSTGAQTKSITISKAGTYWVKAYVAAGCSTQSANSVITVNATSSAPTITVSGSLALNTSNPSVTLTSSVANSYSWTNGATTQSITVSTAGAYSVTVNGTSGCASTSTLVTVTKSTVGGCVLPLAPVITASGSVNLCQGSSVTLTSSIANGYLWSTGAQTKSITVSTAGTYWVRAYVAASCSTQSASTVVTVNSGSTTTPTITASGTLSLTASIPSVTLTSSTASSYSWSSGASTRSITVTTAGVYYVTVNGSTGCSARSANVTVSKSGCTPPAVPVVSLSGSPVLQTGQTVTLTSPVAGGYLWSTGAITRSIVVSNAGSYTVRNYSGSNCYSVSSAVTITKAALMARKIEPIANFHEFAVYPNPATIQVNISYTATEAQEVLLILFDMTGREMIRRTIQSEEGENKLELPVYDYPRGIYFANLISKEEKQTIKLILH